MNLGFIGLGAMGRPMALHLIKAGHALSVYARRPEAARPLTDAGATLCDSPAALAAASEVVFTIVTSNADVEGVALGERGLIHGAKPGCVLVDMSTIAPGTARRIAARLAERGIDMIDAPVSGGEQGAINATLSFMVGGEAAAFEKAKPFYELMGKSVTLVGDAGAGQVTKACNQTVVAMTMLAVAEALTFAKKSGVDGTKVREALLGGFANSKILDHHGKKMLERNWKPGFKAWMQQKDLRIVLQSAHELGLAMPGAAVASQLFNAMVGSGMGEEDNMAVIKLIEGLAGIKE